MSRIKDRYPNYMSGDITLSGANTFTTESVTLPVVRPSSGRAGRSTIMEVLWVDLQWATTDLIATGDALLFSIRTGGTPTGVGGLSEGGVFCERTVLNQGATSGFSLLTSGTGGDARMDLTDKNGFGQLLAVDRINICADSVGQAGAITVEWRMYYRFVTVGAEEYIGIVQSQTTSS